MADGSVYMFTVALVSMGTASLLYWLHAIGKRAIAVRYTIVGPALAIVGNGGTGRYATLTLTIGFVTLTLSLILRWIASGHPPYSNQYEFATAFAWGTTLAYLYFERKYKQRSLGVFVVPVAAGFLIYASTLPSTIEPLIPALQNDLLLSFHVASAIFSYGLFTVAFGAAVMYLMQREDHFAWLPSRETLDDIGYRAVALGLPAQALLLVLGMVWAHTAWGRYWGWDPKETAALVTFLVYAGYMHAHSLRGWRGTRSALVLLVGFGAVLFTFFGNYFLGGLHTYGGV
ncbi:MAG: c-type cytochrome biogenesis protein CcsB [Dehalococcoidia bacterium]